MRKRQKWYLILPAALATLLASSFIACAPPEEVAPPVEDGAAPPTQPADTTPPSAITGLAAADAYDGRVNLGWDESTAEDFGHYSIYVSKSQITDVTDMAPVHQIEDIINTTYQASGLEEGIKYYFAVTATDKSSNENTSVACASIISTPMPRGTLDPDLHVDVYHSDMAWAGTTLLADNHNLERPRIIEVHMLGEIIWEYQVLHHLRKYTNPGFDTEWLPNNNILFVLPGNGVYEIDRDGNIVWSCLTEKISHDADRLPNGNTLVVYGNEDNINDAQVKEISPEGEIVWAWYAKDYFNKSPYKDIYNQGWTHTNAATRLLNGNTLISLRNFDLMVEVDPQGSLVKTIGEGIFFSQHDPEALPNGNILAVSQWRDRPHQAIEIDLKTSEIVWQFAIPKRDTWPVRDANRLPNGNTLITGSTEIVEVTAEGKIVWRLTLKGITIEPEERSRLGFYKAERIGIR